MMLVLALVAPLLTGCKPKPPPPIPASLASALNSADEAVRTGGDVAGACEKLSSQLNAHGQAPMPVMMKSDLNSLMREVAVFGATTDDPMPSGRRR